MRKIQIHIKKLLLCLLLGAIVVGCATDGRPSNILSEEEIVPVLKDLEIAYAGVDHTVKDPRQRQTKYEEMNSVVLKKYNLEKEQFYQSYQWYEAQPIILDSIFKLVIIELNKDIIPLQNQKEDAAPRGKVPELK